MAEGDRSGTDVDGPGEHVGDDRAVGTPDPVERVREGKDPGWPIPGFPGRPGLADSPVSDADAPAPPG